VLEFSPEVLQSCTYQAGKTLLLQGQHKDVTTGKLTETELQHRLRVDTVISIGVYGEEYDVTVLAYGLPAPGASAGAADPPALAGSLVASSCL
jgi:hypothetical protein